MDKLNLLCDSAMGIYIPKIMVSRLFEAGWNGISEEDVRILEEGPEHEQYLDAWDDIENNARYIDADGREWALYQDGDLWAYDVQAAQDGDLDEFFGE